MTTAPTPRELLERELVRVDARISWILSEGRTAFSDDSLAYDVAVVAIVRLAALFEDEKDRYGELLSSVTVAERRGVIVTRNIAAHHGYDAMDVEEFWVTMTRDVPTLIGKIRQALDKDG